MGVVDDVRKLQQDLVTPEMRALAVKVDGLSEKTDQLNDKIDATRKDLNDNIDATREDLNDKIENFRVEMNRRFDYIETSFRLDERVSNLEEERRKERRKQ